MSIVTPVPISPATLDDLLRVEGKAELIGGHIVRIMPSGHAPSRAAFKIAIRLEEYAQRTKLGTAYADGVGYAVRPPLASGRQSFCPDASFFAGALPSNSMRFIDGPPTLAVEVRSESDYTRTAEAERADKRADYFAAGTVVLWDVDPAAGEIRSFRAGAPDRPAVFRRGDLADAEPALPGWQVAVDDVFG